jgi:hypothetical protein
MQVPKKYTKLDLDGPHLGVTGRRQEVTSESNGYNKVPREYFNIRIYEYGIP